MDTQIFEKAIESIKKKKRNTHVSPTSTRTQLSNE
jgi:hypothetical protein